MSIEEREELIGLDERGDGPGERDRGRGGLSAPVPQSYREVTFAAIIFAIIIGVAMNAAITYAGLKIGFTIGGSAIAAVLGFGVLRGLLRRGSILETNIAQTIASAINTSNSGVIFTVPVLFLLGFQLSITGPDFWLITLACIAGAFLGTAFIIPLRKQMLDIERLRFPSATAVGSILKSPGAGPAKAVVLVFGVLIGAGIYLPAAMPQIQGPAELERLDHLFEEGRISHQTREITREIADWIESREAPADVTARGKVVAELELAREAVTKAREDKAGIAEAKAALEEVEGRLAALRGESPRYNDELALAAYLASDGETDWERLRDIDNGWAPVGGWGYSNLQIRLPEELDLDRVDPVDLDGDGIEEAALTRRVDRDQDGRPDLALTDSTVDAGRFFGLPDEYQLVFAIAPFALGAGFLTGKAGLYVLAGGILAFFVINPIAFGFGYVPETMRADEVPNYAWGALNRPLGIGMLLGGALMGVLASLPSIREAIKSIIFARRTKGGRDELGFGSILLIVIAAGAFLYLTADLVGNKPINLTCPVTQVELTGDEAPAEPVTVEYQGYTIALADEAAADEWESWPGEQRDAFMATLNARPGLLAKLGPHWRAAILAIIGAAWIWFAGIIIAQCTGMTDWSPISGMALLTVVLVLLLAGSGAVIAAVLIGAALCVAITLAADMMADLKTGYLVGAIPKRQQTVEVLFVWIGPIVCMLTLWLIVETNMKQYLIPIGQGTPTTAPQAQALQAVITGVQGGDMPYALYGVGALLGALLGLGAFSGLGVLVGLSMYLPFMYISTYGIGCILNILVSKAFGKTRAEDWGVPFCAGLIVGESMLQLGFNLYIMLQG